MEPGNKCDKPGSHAKQKQTINLKIKIKMKIKSLMYVLMGTMLVTTSCSDNELEKVTMVRELLTR